MNQSPPNFAQRLNLFLYRLHLRKLGPTEIETARNWCLNFIRREHPHFSEEEVERFYESLIQVELIPIDEWSRRMN
jgi:hypothetical protein